MAPWSLLLLGWVGQAAGADNDVVKLFQKQDVGSGNGFVVLSLVKPHQITHFQTIDCSPIGVY